jgi:hypothetical protein
VRVTEEVLTQLKAAALSTGLVINKSKTKYMKINRNITNLEQDLKIGGHVIKGIQNFTYLCKVKLSLYRPSLTHRRPGDPRLPEFLDNQHMKVVRLSALYIIQDPWHSFLSHT